MLARLIKNMEGSGASPLLEAIDEYYLRRGKAKKRVTNYSISLLPPVRPYGRLSPSGLGGCQRASVMAFVGLPGVRRSIDDEMVLDQGTWIHHKWQSTFLDMQEVLGVKRFEVRSLEKAVFMPRFYLAGSLDAEVLINNQPYIIDIKSANDWNYSKFVETGTKDSYIWQINAYMWANRTKRGIILYDNKNNQSIRTDHLEADTAILKQIMQWSDDIVGYLESATLPDRDINCKEDNMMGQKCPFRKYCYGDIPRKKLESKTYENFTTPKDYWERGLKIQLRRKARSDIIRP